MTKFRVSMLAAGSLIGIAASAQDAPVLRSPQSIGSAPVEMNFVPMLIEFAPGPAVCTEGAVTPLAIEPPFPVTMAGIGKEPLPQIGLRFAIDPDGRPISIEREPNRDFERARFLL